MEKRLLTTSGLKSYRTCPRLYHLEYVKMYGMRTASEPLVFGTLLHKSLEAWWKASMVTQDRETWLLASLDHLDDLQNRFLAAKLTAAMLGYHERWKDMLWNGKPIRVIAVEIQFETPLVNPSTGKQSPMWNFGGKIDGLIEIDSNVYVLEHKSSSEDFSSGSDYWRALMLDGQVSNYLDGVRALGYEPAGCIYDVIRSASLRPKRKVTVVKLKKDGNPYKGQQLADETPDEYQDRILSAMVKNPNSFYARAEIVRLADDELEARHDRWLGAKQIRESINDSVWPKAPSACRKYNRLCGFFPVCSGTSLVTNDQLYRQKRAVHEELIPEVDETDPWDVEVAVSAEPAE